MRDRLDQEKDALQHQLDARDEEVAELTAVKKTEDESRCVVRCVLFVFAKKILRKYNVYST